ncbi:FtsK/SpoIIIE domain-containing protein [Pseudonocardia sp. GCM10023141]|uniref:FtsK/SpoIIIE domain-containing protein n=1 Tax=Pseudonocardia sp. GCM10023141 TaxID=3252653 RepID=UPI003621057B
MPGPRSGTPARTTRSAGREFLALAWLARHPQFVLMPAALAYGLIAAGWLLVTCVVAALVGVTVGWHRAHPPSFDRYAAPRLRTWWRRWTVYRGRRWRALLDECDLSKEQRRTGNVVYPALTRVRSVTPSIDTARVRIAPGQDLQMWTDRLPALTEALCAHRIGLSRVRPGTVMLIIERHMPFTSPIDATPMPDTAAEVDLHAVVIGEDEYGQPFPIRVRGKHILGVGATGAGKSGFIWDPLRGMAPAIRDGYVRIWMIDLKGGTETERGQAAFHRWATTMDQAVALVTEFRDSMTERQAWMRANRVRTCPVTPQTPINILVVDEYAMLSAYGDKTAVRTAMALLGEVMTQGRAADHTVWAFLQEPTKDIIDNRDLFNYRLCLGVTTAAHVDMVLGEGARDRGALADEIPGDPQHSGIGFAINPGSRAPVRFRLGWVEDHEIDDFARFCTPPPAPTVINGEVVPFRKTTTTDTDDSDTDDSDESGEESAS